MALVLGCGAAVLVPPLVFESGTDTRAAAAEAAHAVLLLLLVVVGLRLPLRAGLAVAIACEAILAAERIHQGGGSPAPIVLMWTVLGPGLVTVTWALSEHQRRIARAEARAAIVALARAIETNHEGTGEHSDDVVGLALAVGRRMGLGAAEREDLALAAQLHDVGKIGVPQSILDKPGPLTPEEAAEMRRHPDIGADLVAQVPSLAGIAEQVRAMHERWDGRGYPRGLAGDAIPSHARIVFACDAYSAMRQDRPYKPAMDPGAALAELRRCAGTQFDPAVVEAVVAVLADGRHMTGAPGGT